MLQQQHQGLQATRAGAASHKQNLNPQQELKLVRYIKEITKQGLPPTRAMIQNFGSVVAQDPCSDCWVFQFLEQSKAHLTSKWTVRMDCNCVKADNKDSYHHYFELLQAKIQQYNVELRYIYNMDKKGFLISITLRQKRVFSQKLWEQKRVMAGLQDGSRRWITVLATVCADGNSLDPAVIYKGKGTLCSGWVHDVEAGKHQVFCTSPSGWSNDDVGLVWLEQVFDWRTKHKA
jgi:hypothetical protein